MALSVAVRRGPAVTAVNGTVVARPARTTWYTLEPLAPALAAMRGLPSVTSRLHGGLLGWSLVAFSLSARRQRAISRFAGRVACGQDAR
jgi:hypothetical protein